MNVKLFRPDLQEVIYEEDDDTIEWLAFIPIPPRDGRLFNCPARFLHPLNQRVSASVDLRRFLHQSFDVMLEPGASVGFDCKVLYRKILPLDRRTTASGTSIQCSFGSVTVRERVSHGRIGKSPESRQPVQARFQIVPCPWNRPALYVTEHWTGKRRKGRIEKGMGFPEGG